MGMRIPSVRGAVQPSNGSDGETLPPPPLSFRLLRTRFPYSLYIEQLPETPRGSTAPLAEPLPPSPWTKGVVVRGDGGRRPWRWGVVVRGDGGSSSVEMGVVVHGDGGSSSVEMGGRRPWTSGVALRGRRGGSPKAGNGVRQPHSFRIARPFQQNGVAVPARRHRRSGETGATPPRGRAELSGKSPRPKIHRPARGGKTAAQYDAELGLKHPTL